MTMRRGRWLVLAPLRVAKEYSYRARQIAGDGWVLVGDALGFLDPLYSSGVLLALKSGALAADAIAEGLAKGESLAGKRCVIVEDVTSASIAEVRNAYDTTDLRQRLARYHGDNTDGALRNLENRPLLHFVHPKHEPYFLIRHYVQFEKRVRSTPPF